MSNPLDPSVWQQAVAGYWSHLTTQQENQGALSGIKDTGNRAAVTGGKQMDLMQAVVADLWLSDPEIHLEVRTTGHNDLPTYFRPSKNWDLVVLYRRRTHRRDGVQVTARTLVWQQFQQSD
ncbi:PaeR7I family type II restriction endonuclease [Actinomyces trachealis]|uniref:PaeR7I family type II restriction endonuclease n=1 Tax=Actinomyces trachealis TaxID=2763540 RepID=UPI001FD5CE11|nr:PaeR7I family type II restriction endonuclease [Actinomyces trachealis]